MKAGLIIIAHVGVTGVTSLSSDSASMRSLMVSNSAYPNPLIRLVPVSIGSRTEVA